MRRTSRCACRSRRSSRWRRPRSPASSRAATGRRACSTYALGLFGPQGPLPLHVTLHAFERARHHDDPTLAHFADIFQHRLLALFYRAWADAQPTVQHDRPAADRFRYYLGALFGLGMAAQQDRDTVPDRFKLFHAGGLGMQTRPPEVLERLVRDFFQVPAAVREFTGGWLRLPEALCCRLGVEAEFARLGRGARRGHAHPAAAAALPATRSGR